MFVPRAHVQISNPRNKRDWFSSGSSRRNRHVRYKLKWYECVRMPCLLPTILGSVIGLFILCGGGLLCFAGYNPGKIFGNQESPSLVVRNLTRNTTENIEIQNLQWRSLTYIGPVFMGIGFFVMMVAVVLYCEIKDKYVNNILPQRNVKDVRKEELYNLIIAEFRKNYFRGIEVPIKKRSSKKEKRKSIEKEYPTLFRALSISSPALLITPDVQRQWHDTTEAVTPTVRRKKKRPSGFHETWLKTSSMPNIRPKPVARIVPRVPERVGKREKYSTIKSKSYDYKDVIKSPDSETDCKSSCFDNPAFRTSPTDKTPRINISPPTSPESTGSCDDKYVTKVIVHMDGNCDIRNQDNYSTNSIKPSDARGYTLRRDSHISNQECRIVNEMGTDYDTHSIVTLEDIALASDSDNEDQQYCQKNLKGCQSELYIDHGNRGPYKTLIGVYRSESCLDRIRKFASRSRDNDNESLDSLTLSDDLMRNFEMKVFSKS